jgi:hypothetical protein
MALGKIKLKCEDLAAMAKSDLCRMDGCPTAGVNLVVYGSNPWNAWLSFGVEAGPVPNQAELRRFLDVIVERLRRHYDVAD